MNYKIGEIAKLTNLTTEQFDTMKNLVYWELEMIGL